MDRAQQDSVRERFSARLQVYGRDPRTLGWGSSLDPEQRLESFSREILSASAKSIVDVGCGYGALLSHLGKIGWKGTYHGVDIVTQLLDLVEPIDGINHSTSAASCDDDLSDLGMFDVSVASGVFNYEVASGNVEFIQASLSSMWLITRKRLVVDFMSTHVDWRHVGSWHMDPELALRLGQDLPDGSPTLRDDYASYEFMLIVDRE